MDLKSRNYGGIFDSETMTISENLSKVTGWTADYEIYPGLNGRIDKIVGVFAATRNFKDSFADAVIIKGNKLGIHKFEFDRFQYGADGRIESMIGSFSNVNVEKEGEIAFFRTRKMRDEYLLNNYPEVLELNKKK